MKNKMKWLDVYLFLFFFFLENLKIVYFIYLYGYCFYVLKIVYLFFDFLIGNFIVFNLDICCLNNECMRVIWVDLWWINGFILGVNFINLFFKDMVIVLVNGYVIICFMVDNFGICLSICRF